MFAKKNIIIYGGANSAVDILFYIARKRKISYEKIYIIGAVKWLQKSQDWA
jgi:hypothetical protein